MRCHGFHAGAEYGNLAARKLQMAEFAIANLYVDSVDENKLVEEAIIHMARPARSALHVQ